MGTVSFRSCQPIIALAIQTGLRRGELLGLRWQNVDLHRRFVLIPDSKNGRSRHVVLTRRVIRVLAALPRNTERVFPISAPVPAVMGEDPDLASLNNPILIQTVS
jgi:integrase